MLANAEQIDSFIMNYILFSMSYAYQMPKTFGKLCWQFAKQSQNIDCCDSWLLLNIIYGFTFILALTEGHCHRYFCCSLCVCVCCSLFCCCPTKRALINKFVWLPTRTHRIGNPRDLWIMGQNHQEDTLCNYLSICAKQSAMFSNNKHGWIMACAI